MRASNEEGDAEDPEVVDKILTSPLRRGDGTAHALIERVLQVSAERWPGRGVRLTAPVSLRTFYEAFGFRKTEGPFLEHGMSFIGLTRKSRQSRDSAAAKSPKGPDAFATTYELL